MGGRRKIGYGEDELNPREAQKASVQSRKEKQQRIAAIISAFDVQPLTADEAALIDRMLLTMTQKELREFAQDENKPNEMRRRAVILLDKSTKAAIDMAEKMRDRAFGKPAQQVNLQTNEKPPIQILPDEQQ